MRNVKIVADSSANLMELKAVAFDAAPLKIITAEREFVDNRELDLNEMIHFFRSYKGRSQTSCLLWSRAIRMRGKRYVLY